MARPIELAMKVAPFHAELFGFFFRQRTNQSFDLFCCAFCGRGMNSSFETICVGIGESIPLSRSGFHFGIHMVRNSWLVFRSSKSSGWNSGHFCQWSL